jgi:hypothetical protein
MNSSSESLDRACLRTFNDGRRCRMLRKPGHPSLCVFHAREEAQLLETERLAAELSSLSGNLRSGTEINEVLAKVFKALSERRISAREASSFAYLCQLLLQTLPLVKNEIYWIRQDAAAYHNLLRASVPQLCNLADVPSPAAALLAACRRPQKLPLTGRVAAPDHHPATCSPQNPTTLHTPVQPAEPRQPADLPRLPDLPDSPSSHPAGTGSLTGDAPSYHTDKQTKETGNGVAPPLRRP